MPDAGTVVRDRIKLRACTSRSEDGLFKNEEKYMYGRRHGCVSMLTVAPADPLNVFRRHLQLVPFNYLITARGMYIVIEQQVQV